MNKIARYALICCLGMGLFSSCVKDGEEICDTFVRFVYEYNIGGADMAVPGVDLFYRQASKVDLFIFDGSGIFLEKVTSTSEGDTFDRDFRLTLPRNLPADAQFVAWAGLYDDSCSVTDMVKGQSTLADLRVSAKPSRSNIMDRDLRPLMHGTILGEPKAVSYVNETITVYMSKNTNNIRFNLEVIDEDNNMLDSEDFDFSVTVANRSYDHLNNIVSPADMLEYIPFVQNHNAETGVGAELKLLRLMANREARLLITHKPSGGKVFEKNLTPYLAASCPEKYGYMNNQEYLDREDTYRVIIFLRYEPGTPQGENPFVAFSIQVNDWSIRIQDSEISPNH